MRSTISNQGQSCVCSRFMACLILLWCAIGRARADHDSHRSRSSAVARLDELECTTAPPVTDCGRGALVSDIDSSRGLLTSVPIARCYRGDLACSCGTRCSHRNCQWDSVSWLARMALGERPRLERHSRRAQMKHTRHCECRLIRSADRAHEAVDRELNGSACAAGRGRAVFGSERNRP